MQTTSSGYSVAVLRCADRSNSDGTRQLLLTDAWDIEAAKLLADSTRSATTDADEFLRLCPVADLHRLDAERRHDLIAEAAAHLFIVTEEATSLLGLRDQTDDLDPETLDALLDPAHPYSLIVADDDLSERLAQSERTLTALRMQIAVLSRKQPIRALLALLAPRRLGPNRLTTLAEALRLALDAVRKHLRSAYDAHRCAQLQSTSLQFAYPPRLIRDCQQSARVLPDRAPPSGAVTPTARADSSIAP